MSPESALTATAKKNVETIAQLEQQLLRQRSRLEHVGERIAGFFGSFYFIVAHAALIATWLLLNVRAIPGVRPFDPYPFALLSTLVGIEFILLTTFVLMNQKHQMRRGEQWVHLQLQLSMLTEQEVTKNMQILNLICQELRLTHPTHSHALEVQELTQATQVSALVDEIEKVRDSGNVLANELETDKSSGVA